MNGIIYALIASAGWALNGVVYKVGLRDVTPFTANFHRTLFATTFLGAVTIATGHMSDLLRIDSVTWVVLFASAIFSFYLGDLLYFSSLKSCPLSLALPISSTYPVYVVLISPVLYGVEFRVQNLLSAILVFLAVYVLFYDSKNDGTGRGILFALSAAVSWAFAILSLDFLTSKLPVDVVAFVRMGIALILLTFSVESKEVKNKNSMIFSGFLGGVITSASILLFITAVHISGSWNVAQPSATSPVLGALAGKVAFGEKMDVRTIVSVSLVAVSISLLLLR